MFEKMGPNFRILDPVPEIPQKQNFPVNAFNGCYNTSRLNLQQKIIYTSRAKYNIPLNCAKTKSVYGYSVNLCDEIDFYSSWLLVNKLTIFSFVSR